MRNETPNSSREVDICCHIPTNFNFSRLQYRLILYIDASKDGLGCALYQQQQDQSRVIGHDSRPLVGAKKLRWNTLTQKGYIS